MESTIYLTQRSSLQKIVPFFLGLTLLVLPLSSSAKSIFLTLTVISIVLLPTFRTDFAKIVKTPWCIAAFSLFLIAFLDCSFSPASFADKKFVLEKYSKLLYLPILTLGFQTAFSRKLAIHGFLFAISITCFLSIFKYYGFLGMFQFDPDHVFRNHIITGFMVAFGTYLASLLAYRSRGWNRIGYAFLSFLFTYQVLFISGGRTGYVIYLIVMGILILQLCSWRQAMMGCSLVLGILLISYLTSPVMQSRVAATFQQLEDYKHNEKNTDLGYRFQFHDYAQNLFLRHPIIGNGTASFTHFYVVENPMPQRPWKLLEPHSQYWLIASEFGIIGLGLFSFFFFTLFRNSLQLDSMKPVAIALLIPFLLGSLSDSLLFYSGPGYLFILFMALCLGEKAEKMFNKNSSQRILFD